MTSSLENQAITALQTSYHQLQPSSSSSYIGCEDLAAAFIDSKFQDDQLLNIAKKCYKRFEDRFVDFKNLSLYHFAAIGNRVSILTQLFRDLPLTRYMGHLKDSEGNTPLHIRAMLTKMKDVSKDPFIKAILTKCESKEIDCTTHTNNVGLTYLQLHQLSQQQAPALPETFNAKCFENKKYSPVPIVSQQTLLKLWLKIFSSTTAPKDISGYLNGMQNPPKLSIQPSGISKTCAVTALEDIPKFRIVAEMGGQFIVEPSISFASSANFLSLGSNPPYGLDFSKYKNAASFISDGPPNCIATPLSNLWGLPQRALVISLGIKAGEQPFIDHGLLHTPKYTKKETPHLSIVVDFVQNAASSIFSNWDSYDEDISNELNSSDPDPAVSQKLKTVGMYKYILSTPAVAFRLIKDGLINHLDLFQAINVLYPQTFYLETLLKGHLFHAFLLASIRDILINEKNNLVYFETLFKIIMDNFGKSMTSQTGDPGIGRLFFIHHYLDTFFRIFDRIRNNQLVSENELKDLFELKNSSNLKNLNEVIATKNSQFIESMRAWYTNAIDEYCKRIFIGVSGHVQAYGHSFAESNRTSTVDYTAAANNNTDSI